MIKKTITYIDYNDVERTEDFYFNLSKAEAMEMELGVVGGLSSMMERIVKAQDVPEIMRIFKEIVMKAYGQKSPDGKRFIKSCELSEEFIQTEAFSNLFVELVSNENALAAFMNGITPKVEGPSNVAPIAAQK